MITNIKHDRIRLHSCLLYIFIIHYFKQIRTSHHRKTQNKERNEIKGKSIIEQNSFVN